MPAVRSPPWRDGSITAAKNFENVSVITSTGNIAACPNPTGIRGSGNHRSICAACPG